MNFRISPPVEDSSCGGSRNRPLAERCGRQPGGSGWTCAKRERAVWSPGAAYAKRISNRAPSAPVAKALVVKALAECAPPEAGASTIGVGAGGTIGGGGGGRRPRERGGAAAPRWEPCRCSSRVGDDVGSRVVAGTIGRTSQSAETGTCGRELDAPVAAWRRAFAGAAVAERHRSTGAQSAVPRRVVGAVGRHRERGDDAGGARYRERGRRAWRGARHGRRRRCGNGRRRCGYGRRLGRLRTRRHWWHRHRRRRRRCRWQQRSLRCVLHRRRRVLGSRRCVGADRLHHVTGVSGARDANRNRDVAAHADGRARADRRRRRRVPAVPVPVQDERGGISREVREPRTEAGPRRSSSTSSRQGYAG